MARRRGIEEEGERDRLLVSVCCSSEPLRRQSVDACQLLPGMTCEAKFGAFLLAISARSSSHGRLYVYRRRGAAQQIVRKSPAAFLLRIVEGLVFHPRRAKVGVRRRPAVA